MHFEPRLQKMTAEGLRHEQLKIHDNRVSPAHPT